MKINEASVIDNKVIDEMIAECLHPEVYEALLHIKSHLKPLEPIIQDSFNYGYCSAITLNDYNEYINETEI